MEFSIVIPVKDEAECIGGLIEEIAAVLADRFDYEILCVDDGSTDDTADRIDGMRAQFPRMRLLRHAENRGQSAALRTGVRLARSEWIVTLDGDGQNDPADIAALWALAQEPEKPSVPELIVGHRHRRRDSWRRRAASRLANGIRARLLGDATPDSACGLKLFPRDLFLDLPYFDHMHRFLPALVIREGGRVRSIPVNHRQRRGGKSKYDNWGRFRVGIVDLLGVMWLKRRARLPIRAKEGR